MIVILLLLSLLRVIEDSLVSVEPLVLLVLLAHVVLLVQLVTMVPRSELHVYLDQRNVISS